MSRLYRTDNAKTKFETEHRNTVGFMYGSPSDGGTCPGATKGCGGCLDVREGKKRQTCYMAKITKIYPAVAKTLARNTELMNNATFDEKVELLDEMISEFKQNTDQDKWFWRWNYSGDWKDEEWAKACHAVMVKHPDVKFWAYTRSYWFAHLFRDMPNFALYLSIDPVNKEAVMAAYSPLMECKNISLAWMDSKTAPDETRWVTCPETSGRVKNEASRGACSKCQLCFTFNDKIKLRNIAFCIH